MKHWNKQWLLVVLGAVMSLSNFRRVEAEVCTTQSLMEPSERDALAGAVQALALKIRSNDQAGVQSSTIPEFVANFSGIGNAIASVAPKLTGSNPELEQIYILDATANKKNPDGSFPDAEFICTLNKGNNKDLAEADFSINALPAGRYAFAMVDYVGGQSPWLISMLLRQDGAAAPWKLAGFFPKETSAAGHDGLWYWSQARAQAANKQSWASFINYQQARLLLQPAVFVSSTHLENLRAESTTAMPPELANGIGVDTPVVIKGANGAEYRITALAPDSSLKNDKLEVSVHMMMDTTITDPVAAQKRNRDAMSALLTQHPDLRDNFHGIWLFAEAPDRPPVATEAAMNDIH